MWCLGAALKTGGLDALSSIVKRLTGNKTLLVTAYWGVLDTSHGITEIRFRVRRRSTFDELPPENETILSPEFRPG